MQPATHTLGSATFPISKNMRTQIRNKMFLYISRMISSGTSERTKQVKPTETEAVPSHSTFGRGWLSLL